MWGESLLARVISTDPSPAYSVERDGLVLAILVRRVEARTALLPQVTSSRRHYHGNDVGYLCDELLTSSWQSCMHVLHILHYLNMLWICRVAAYADIFRSVMGLYMHTPGREKILLFFSCLFLLSSAWASLHTNVYPHPAIQGQGTCCIRVSILIRPSKARALVAYECPSSSGHPRPGHLLHTSVHPHPAIQGQGPSL